MPASMPNEQVDEGLLSFKSTFADETKGEGRILHGGWQGPPELIAQIDEDVDLRWVVELRRRVGCTELKYGHWGRLICEIDAGLYGAMRETWQKTNIIITDSWPAMSEVQYHFRSGALGEVLDAPLVRKAAKKIAAGLMLFDTPLLRLGHLANGAKPGLFLPGEGDVLPEWADPLCLRGKLGNQLIKTKLFVGRLNASNFDLCDDDLFNSEFEKAITDCGPFGFRPDYERLLIRFSLIRRVFDGGHKGILDMVRAVRNESLADLVSRQGTILPEIEEADSRSTGVKGDAIQAADIAAGLAKEYYERAGIPGVLDHFRAVLYNGKVVR